MASEIITALFDDLGAPPTSTRSVLHGYAPKGSRYDECVDEAGRLRPAWAQFFGLLHGNQAEAIRTASDASHTAYGCGRESELTFYGRAVFDEQLRRHTLSFEQAHAARKAAQHEVVQ